MTLLASYRDWICWLFVRVDEGGAILVCLTNQGPSLQFAEDKPEEFICFVAAFWGMRTEERRRRILSSRESWTAARVMVP